MMAKLIHLDTGEVLGKKVLWKKMPYKARMLLHPYKKGKKLTFFQDFVNPSVFGCVLKDKGVVME